MKILSFLILLSAWSAYGVEGSLECQVNGRSFKVSLNSEWDEHEDFVKNCSADLYHGDVCFRGNRSAVIELIKLFEANDIWGGEEWPTDAHYHGRDAISYQIEDGPNQKISENRLIYRCK